MNSPVERFIASLDSNGCKPKKNGKGYQATCPAHPDSHPSLTVSEGSDGRALVHCHGGCPVEDVLDAVGLTMSDLMNGDRDPLPRSKAEHHWLSMTPIPSSAPPPESHPNLGDPKVRWHYRDPDGRPLGDVCRWDTTNGKEIRPCTYGRTSNETPGCEHWSWKSWTTPAPLFGLFELEKLPNARVLVVEGEKTAEAAAALFPNLAVVTSPGGSDSPHGADWSPLKGREVVVWPDQDVPGQKFVHAVADLTRQAGAKSVATVTVPKTWPKGWDLADDPPEDVSRHDLVTMVERAIPWVSATPAPNSTSSWRTLREYQEHPELIQEPAEVVPNLAWRGRVTLLAAREKSGKSTFAAFGAALLTQAPEAGVVWVNLEEAPFDVVNRFEGMNADPDRVVISEYLPNKLDDLAEAIVSYDPALVVIDTLSAWVAGRVTDLNAAAQMTPAMLELVELARRHNVALVLLHHGKKTDGTYRDSTAIGALVDVIIEMSPDDKDDHTRHFKPKGRWTVEPFSMRWTGTTYEPVQADRPISERVHDFISQHPECSKRAVRVNVTGKNATIDDAIDLLIRENKVEDRGNSTASQYHAIPQAVADPGPCINPVDPQDKGAQDRHAEGTLSFDFAGGNGASTGHGEDTHKGTPPAPPPISSGSGGTVTEDSRQKQIEPASTAGEEGETPTDPDDDNSDCVTPTRPELPESSRYWEKHLQLRIRHHMCNSVPKTIATEWVRREYAEGLHD